MGRRRNIKETHFRFLSGFFSVSFGDGQGPIEWHWCWVVLMFDLLCPDRKTGDFHSLKHKDSYSSSFLWDICFQCFQLAFWKEAAKDTICWMSNHPLLSPPSQKATHLAGTFRSQWETGKRLLNEVSYCVTVKSSCWPCSPQQRRLSVMVINCHLVPSWVAQRFKELERRRLATGLFYAPSVSSIRLRFVTWGPLTQHHAVKLAFWHGHQYKGPLSSTGCPFRVQMGKTAGTI